MRRFQESEALNREVLAEYRKLHPEGHPDVATAMYDLSQVLERQEKYVEAESLLLGALVIRRQMLGENALPTVETLNDLGVLQAEKGDTAEAETTLREASERGQAGLGAGHPSTLSALGNLAVVLTRAIQTGGGRVGASPGRGRAPTEA
jgi:tetratricopeptide (TPR) repeat protein